MRDKYAKTNIELKHNSMNIIAYRVKQKIPRTWYYIGEDRLYRKSTTHSRWQGKQIPLGLSCFEHSFWML
jgi:hypothetical protein